MKLTITSDGTPLGTKVTDEAGRLIQGVQEVTFNITVDGTGEVVIRLHPTAVKLAVEGELKPTMEDMQSELLQRLRKATTTEWSPP